MGLRHRMLSSPTAPFLGRWKFVKSSHAPWTWGLFKLKDPQRTSSLLKDRGSFVKGYLGNVISHKIDNEDWTHVFWSEHFGTACLGMSGPFLPSCPPACLSTPAIQFQSQSHVNHSLMELIFPSTVFPSVPGLL